MILDGGLPQFSHWISSEKKVAKNNSRAQKVQNSMGGGKKHGNPSNKQEKNQMRFSVMSNQFISIYLTFALQWRAQKILLRPTK